MNERGGADLNGAADLEPGWSGPQIGDVARLVAVLAILVVLAVLLIAATHAVPPDCGGG